MQSKQEKKSKNTIYDWFLSGDYLRIRCKSGDYTPPKMQNGVGKWGSGTTRSLLEPFFLLLKRLEVWKWAEN